MTVSVTITSRSFFKDASGGSYSPITGGVFFADGAALEGAPVEVLRRAAGALAWQTIATTETNAAGAFSVALPTGLSAGEYEYLVIAGDKTSPILRQWVDNGVYVRPQGGTPPQKLGALPFSSRTLKPHQAAIVGRGQSVDMTAEVQTLIDAASAKGVASGERVDISIAGVVAVTGLVMKSNVGLIGYGGAKAVIRLINGSNKTVIKGQNFDTLTGTNTASAVQRWALKSLIIDGNRANNATPASTEGLGVQVYGRDFEVYDVEVRDAYRTGLWLEYSNGSVGISPFNGRVCGITADRCGENGIVLGVSDCQVDDLNVRSVSQNTDNGFDAIRLDAAAHIGTRVNVWRGGTETNKHRYSLNITSGAATTRFDGVLETAGTANVFLGANNCQIRCRSYNNVGTYHFIVDGHENQVELNFHKGALAAASGTVGLKLGGTLAARNNQIRINGITAPTGAVDFVNSGGGNIIVANVFLATGEELFAGSPHALDDVTIVGMASAAGDRRTFRKHPHDSSNFVAFGTSSTNATRLTRSRVKVNTNDTTGNNGVKLSTPTAGQAIAGVEYVITNVSTVSLWVYPHTDGKFVGSTANVGVQIPAGATWMFFNTGFDWAVLKSA